VVAVTLLDRLSTLGKERSGYVLDSLAEHLAAAGRHDRLRRLFADDHWMTARFEAAYAVYDDYLADLTLAWDAAQNATETAVQHEEEPVALLDCIRYALIWTSINSLSRNFSPELVARAVEVGVMEPTRALSIGRRVPDADQQTHLLARVLATGSLTSQQQEVARRVALDAVRTLDRTGKRAEALVTIAPYLGPELASEALEIARGVAEDYRAAALAAVAPLLDDERRSVASEALHAINLTPQWRRSGAWSELVASLDRTLLDEALRQARVADPKERVYGLAALGGQFAEPRRSEIFADALAALRLISSDKDRIYALSRTIGQFDGPTLPEVATLTLETALGLPLFDSDNDAPQIVGLTAAAPFLAGQELERAVEAALAIPNFKGVNERVKLLAALAARLTGARRSTVVRAALEIARKPQDPGLSEGSWEVQPLLYVAPLLAGEDRTAALRAVLDRALALPSLKQENELVNPRFQALALAAPQLDGQLLAEALASVRDIDDAEARSTGLAGLSSRLGQPARREVAGAALRAVAAVGDSTIRQRVIVAVAPLLPTELLGEALEAANSIRWDLARGDALAAVNPALPPELADRALGYAVAIEFGPARARALTALVPALPEESLDRAIKAAWATDWEPGRTQALAAIADRLTGTRRRRLLDETLSWYADNRHHDRSADMLAALAAHVTGELAAMELQFALQVGSSFGMAQVLEALIPNLPKDLLPQVVEVVPSAGTSRNRLCALLAPGLDGQILNRLFAVAVGRKRDIFAADCIKALSPYLSPKLLDRAILVAAKMDNPTARTVVLEAIGPQLDERRARTAFKIARAIRREPVMRASAMAAVTPRLPGCDLDSGLASTVAAALALDGPWPRAHILAKLVPRLTGEARRTVLEQAVQALLSLLQSGGWQHPADPLLALLPNLDGPQLRTAVLMLLTITDLDERARALDRAPLPTGGVGAVAVRLALADYLQVARQLQRADLIRSLALPIFAPPFLTPAMVESIARTIIEICWNWNWQ
jgi:hypothetical protein